MNNLDELREHCEEIMAISPLRYAYIPASSIITLIERIEKAESELSAATETCSQPIQKKLIGWRMEDYTEETNKIELARNWAPNVGVMPIFEGDINTRISTTTIDTTPL
ncbi:phage-like protein [Yersinia aldovae]|uniref:hypothetical protein n=1 Tax=Yersinia aldovae TaxID=29483 RepID=UPI0005E81655|nr:hypothetical protein [Yersinia aldovae]CNJ88362.1 phage-like protein [Yersinia aldovae]